MICFRSFFAIGVCLTLVGCYRTVVFELTDYNEPAPARQEEFADDQFDAMTAPTFDPNRVDSRQENGWNVNLSAAATRLDVELLKPDLDRELLKLHANYRDAIAGVESKNVKILPSVNLIDGKAKQFDDGLFAALERHWFQGGIEGFSGDLDWLQGMARSVPVDSRAAAYFAVGLELAGIPFAATNQIARNEFQKRFESELLQSKPIGFYAWNETLQQCYRVGRFFQMDFELRDLKWMQPVVGALKQDSDLLVSYRRILARWARLSNAPSRMSMLDMVDHLAAEDFARVRQVRNISSTSVSLFPPGSNRESELTRRLFPNGFSAQADIMRELVKAIRSGAVNLEPTSNSGWYDYQVFALETLLVPKRGEESNRLLLSANYKRRSLEAFQALMTIRKETHILRGETGVKSAAMAPPLPLEHFSPRLRVEPAPTYYLRMARSYRFLDLVLRDFVDDLPLAKLRGLTEKGSRDQLLVEELKDIRRLFYGCYALSAEDLGLAINVTEEESAELEESRNHAEKWLAVLTNDPDLAVDTRVIVPVAEDLQRRVISTWATLGIRFARLKTDYVTEAPPRVKISDTDQWTPLKPDQMSAAIYLIPVDEFASVQVSSSRIFTRAEFQKLCDGATNREQIIKRLQE